MLSLGLLLVDVSITFTFKELLMGSISISFLIGLITPTTEALKAKLVANNTQKLRLTDAHEAINEAFIETYDFVKGTNGGNMSNQKLAKAWGKAAAKVMLIDKQLGEMLHKKSRFWTDPQLFIDMGIQSEVIQLSQIIDEMEAIRLKI